MPGQLLFGGKTRAHFQTPSFSTGISEVMREGVGNSPSTMLTIFYHGFYDSLNICSPKMKLLISIVNIFVQIILGLLRSIYGLNVAARVNSKY